MTSRKEFIITKNLAGLRLDQALAHFLESRNQAVHLIHNGCVRIDKNKKKSPIKPSYLVEQGDCILLTYVEKEKQTSLEPYDFPIPVVYEDDSVLVVNKPAGLVVHPGCGHPKGTLVNALIHKLDSKVGFHPKRPGLVHRLDKEVSGLLVLSKTHQAQNFLAKQFLNKKISRVYWALCYGSFRFDQGRIESFIKRHPVDRKKFISTSSDGKKSITLFKILKKNEDEIAHVQCHLLTGRTHQVRIHSKEFSGGIVGDTVYSSTKKIKKITNSSLSSEIAQLKRIALHAIELTFIHPETKKEMKFHAPFPEELQSILNKI